MLRRLLPFTLALAFGLFGCGAEEQLSNQSALEAEGKDIQATSSQPASDSLDEKRIPTDGETEKRREHCCTFNDPLRLGCVEVFDNDFNSFFACVREIGTNFSMSRGKCQSPPCAYILYR